MAQTEPTFDEVQQQHENRFTGWTRIAEHSSERVTCLRASQPRKGYDRSQNELRKSWMITASRTSSTTTWVGASTTSRAQNDGG